MAARQRALAALVCLSAAACGVAAFEADSDLLTQRHLLQDPLRLHERASGTPASDPWMLAGTEPKLQRPAESLAEWVQNEPYPLPAEHAAVEGWAAADWDLAGWGAAQPSWGATDTWYSGAPHSYYDIPMEATWGSAEPWPYAADRDDFYDMFLAGAQDRYRELPFDDPTGPLAAGWPHVSSDEWAAVQEQWDMPDDGCYDAPCVHGPDASDDLPWLAASHLRGVELPAHVSVLPAGSKWGALGDAVSVDAWPEALDSGARPADPAAWAAADEDAYMQMRRAQFELERAAQAAAAAEAEAALRLRGALGGATAGIKLTFSAEHTHAPADVATGFEEDVQPGSFQDVPADSFVAIDDMLVLSSPPPPPPTALGGWDFAEVAVVAVQPLHGSSDHLLGGEQDVDIIGAALPPLACTRARNLHPQQRLRAQLLTPAVAPSLCSVHPPPQHECAVQMGMAAHAPGCMKRPCPRNGTLYSPGRRAVSSGSLATAHSRWHTR